MKQKQGDNKTTYEDIHLPCNTSAAIFIAGFILFFGFAIIWHIWWLAVFGLCGAFISFLIRMFTEDTEYVLAAADVEKQEVALRGKKIPAPYI